ncbi:MAG: efflux RND transporter permease subunit, partial [Planctomycetes bacterium]|nr:efflux RND transporter permease subunit [Planctomycetota bacterium]
MLEQILAFSLRNRMLVVATSVMVAVLGALQISRTSIDVLPNLDRPVVSILTDAHGLSPESVENLVTRPIERAVGGATGVLRVRSTSSRGLSVVQIDFEWDTDLLDARQIVSERLQLASSALPEDIHAELAPIASIMGQIQLVGLRSRDGSTDAVTLRRIVDRELLPSLLSVPGIAQVTAIGGQPSELQVTVDADKLRAFDVTIEDVADAVQGANVAAAGSTLELGATGPVIAIRGLIESAEDLGSAIVREDPVRPVRLDDVADVLFGPTAVRIGSAGIDG